ncbi:acyl-CoA N-acyltransferase [Daldinia eschscholtzii]|nr:acyl-CoA N-acyltransferase [Daldinia eschscholtzii]
MSKIRLREDADLPGCARALEAVYAKNGYPVYGVGNAIGFLQTDDTAWVAEDANGNITGHIALSKADPSDVSAALWWKLHPQEEQPIAVLGRLFVHPEARGGGIANKLMQTALDEAQRRGQRLVMFALANVPDAIRMYHRLGWEHFGTTVFGWKGDAGEELEMDAQCFASPVLADRK